MITRAEKRFCILCIFMVIILLAIFSLIMYLLFYIENSKEERIFYDEIKNTAISSTINMGDTGINAKDSLEYIETGREVHFEYLKDNNPLISAWIYIPSTVIDYPIVQGIDNFVYLNHDAYGNESSAGSIFIDCLNNADFSDFHTILYGHNKRDGTMFHILHDYIDTDFAEKHDVLSIYMDNGEILNYQLLCTLDVDAYDEKIYSKDNLSQKELTEYILASADYVYGTYNENHLLSLSTCISGSRRRVVVFQKKD